MKTYTLIFVLLSFSINAQSNYNLDNSGTFISYDRSSPSEIDLSTYTGSIYINNDFIEGHVIDKLSQQTFNVFLRYDAHNDAFQANSSNLEEGATHIKKASEIEISYSGNKYKYIHFKNENENPKKGYLLELLNLDSTIIYYRQEKKTIPPKKATSTYHTDTKGTIKNNNYFVVKHKGEIKAEKISKKNIATFFPEDLKEKVAQITKEEKLKYKNPEDILKLAKLLK